MGIFKNIFGGNEENQPGMDWKMLIREQQLDELLEESKEKPVLIFKHSTRCAVSRMVLLQFESSFDLEGQVVPYFLDLLQYRNISNEIAQRFDVEHQSPQMIVIKEGKAVYDASHESIAAEVLNNFL